MTVGIATVGLVHVRESIGNIAPPTSGHPLDTPCDTNARCPRAHVRLRGDRRHAAARRCARESASPSPRSSTTLQHTRRGARSRAVHAQPPRPATRDDVPSDTRFVPIPARVLLPSVGARRHAPHRPVDASGARRPHDELPRAAEPAPDARERLRLLVRAVSRALHARGTRVRADRAPRDRTRRDRAHDFGVRRRRDRGDLRPGLRAAGRLVVIPLGVPPLGTDSGDAARSSTRSSAGAPFVLAIGTLEPRKNLAAPRRARSATLAADASRPPARHRRPRRPGPARRRRRDRRARPERPRRVSSSPARSATPDGARSSTARACSRTRRSTKASASRCSRR